MPSGAKKRKAAKRKEQAAHQINISSTKSNHGNDDPRSQEERESDNSVGSPASHDNENNHTFQTNEEPVKEAYGIGEEVTIKIEKELKSENIEITDSSPDKSSSSSSSSDDESREIKKREDKETGDSAAEVISNVLSKQAISAAANAPFSGLSANVVVENTAPMDSTMPAKPNSEEQIQIENMSEKASAVSAVDTVVSNEDDEKSLPNVNENPAKGVSASDGNTQASSGAIDSNMKESEGKILPVSDPIPETNGVPEGVKESEVPIFHEKEVPVRPTLGVTQRTSWFSCCGLFDVITGSSR